MCMEMALTDRLHRRPSSGAPAELAFDDVLHAARHGQDWACTRLYEALAGQVLGFLRSRGTPDAEEVVNDTFLSAFRGLDSFDGDGAAFRSWVFRIARNRRIDALRRLQRTVDTATLEGIRPESGATFVSDDDVEAAAMAGLDDDQLASLLAPLTVDQRDVMMLRVVAGLSLEETAAVVAKPVGAVKALQHRATRTLQRTHGATRHPVGDPDVDGGGDV